MESQNIPNTPENTPSTWGRKLRKYSRWFVFILVVCMGFYGYWKFFYTYSDGYRSGLLQKLSHKGNLVKTYEGELVMSSITSTSNVVVASEKFYFSVPNDSLAKAMQLMEGKSVRLHYQQKKGVLFWRGDSEYLIDGMSIEDPK